MALDIHTGHAHVSSSCNSQLTNVPPLDITEYKRITCVYCDCYVMNVDYAEHILECQNFNTVLLPVEHITIDTKSSYYNYELTKNDVQLCRTRYISDASQNFELEYNTDTDANESLADESTADDDNNEWLTRLYKINREMYINLTTDITTTNPRAHNTNRQRRYKKNNGLTKAILQAFEILNDDSKECPVCIDTCANHYILPCKHSMCVECGNNWFAMKTTCPICRFKLE